MFDRLFRKQIFAEFNIASLLGLFLLIGLVTLYGCTESSVETSDEEITDMEVSSGEPSELPPLGLERPLIDDPNDKPSGQLLRLFPEFFPKDVKHTIPLKQIMHGGPAKDGIPALTHPETIPAQTANYLKDDDTVLGVSINGESRAYPIRILNWHEIVNDTLAGVSIVVTFCPLCGTGIAFNAKVNNTVHEFGVSGMLYNSDLLMYDRHTATPSLWAQALGEAVVGPKTGVRLKLLPILQTTWAEWRKAHPQTTVLSLNTGFHRDYNRDPYLGYAQNPGLFFPVEPEDARLHPKERILGVILNGFAKAYPLKTLQKLHLLNDTLGGQSIVLIASPDSDAVRVYFSRNHRFEGSSDNVVEADSKQRWIVSEDALSNPKTGTRLERIPNVFVSFWFGWFAFYPDTQLYI